jgi:hypothetical protein
VSRGWKIAVVVVAVGLTVSTPFSWLLDSPDTGQLVAASVQGATGIAALLWAMLRPPAAPQPEATDIPPEHLPVERRWRAALISAAAVLVAFAVLWFTFQHQDKTAGRSDGGSAPGQTKQPSNTGPITGPGAAGRCVDAKTPTDGNPVVLSGCNKTPGQQWTMKSDNTIRAFGKCLDIIHNGKANFDRVELFHCNGAGAQRWVRTPHGALKNPQSGRCLDDPKGDTADGVQLQIFDCNNKPPQRWATPAIRSSTS